MSPGLGTAASALECWDRVCDMSQGSTRGGCGLCPGCREGCAVSVGACSITGGCRVCGECVPKGRVPGCASVWGGVSCPVRGSLGAAGWAWLGRQLLRAVAVSVPLL